MHAKSLLYLEEMFHSSIGLYPVVLVVIYVRGHGRHELQTHLYNVCTKARCHADLDGSIEVFEKCFWQLVHFLWVDLCYVRDEPHVRRTQSRELKQEKQLLENSTVTYYSQYQMTAVRLKVLPYDLTRG